MTLVVISETVLGNSDVISVHLNYMHIDTGEAHGVASKLQKEPEESDTHAKILKNASRDLKPGYGPNKA